MRSYRLMLLTLACAAACSLGSSTASAPPQGKSTSEEGPRAPGLEPVGTEGPRRSKGVGPDEGVKPERKEPRPRFSSEGPLQEELRCDKGRRGSGCFLEVPAGAFLMGAQSTDPGAPGYDPRARPEEAPPHQVSLPSFWIQRQEVSTSEYQFCVQEGWCSEEAVATSGGFSNYGQQTRRQYPINSVTWAGAVRYCAFLGARLPTEAEWEYAARGTSGRAFPWGDEPRCGVKNDHPTELATDPGREETCHNEGTVPLGRLRGTSEAGVMGMAGSVWEWTADWYAADAYATHDAASPRGPVSGTRRVQRGGGWTSEDAFELRSAARGGLKPDDKFNDVGFRCVRDLGGEG